MTLKEQYLEFFKLDECYRLLDSNILDNAEEIQNAMEVLKHKLKETGIEIDIEDYDKYSEEGKQLAKKIFTYLQECFIEESKLINKENVKWD